MGTIGGKYETKINAMEMDYLRRIAVKTQWDGMKNEDIRKENNRKVNK